jgi:hypothetical protein
MSSENQEIKDVLRCQVCHLKKAKKGCRACRQFICNVCFGETNHGVHNEELYYPNFKIEIEDLVKDYQKDLIDRYEKLKVIEETTMKEQSKNKGNPIELQPLIDKKQNDFLENIKEFEKLTDFFKRLKTQVDQYFMEINSSNEGGIWKFRANDFKMCKDILVNF